MNQNKRLACPAPFACREERRALCCCASRRHDRRSKLERAPGGKSQVSRAMTESPKKSGSSSSDFDSATCPTSRTPMHAQPRKLNRTPIQRFCQACSHNQNLLSIGRFHKSVQLLQRRAAVDQLRRRGPALAKSVTFSATTSAAARSISRCPGADHGPCAQMSARCRRSSSRRHRQLSGLHRDAAPRGVRHAEIALGLARWAPPQLRHRVDPHRGQLVEPVSSTTSACSLRASAGPPRTYDQPATNTPTS